MKPKIVTKGLEEEILRRYEYQDGKLISKVKMSRVAIGQVIGSPCERGYLRFSVNKKKFLVHRVIYFLFHRIWPEEIDHINRDKTDNRIENLRSVTRSENKWNVDYGEDAGIRFHNGAWESAVTVRDKNIYLGRYSSKRKAKSARDAYIEESSLLQVKEIRREEEIND